MNKYFKVSVMTVVMMLILSGVALADPLSMFIADQREAWSKTVQIWCAGGSRAELLGAIKQGIQAESGMMAYGVSFNDERLYSRLARKLKLTEPEQFASALFMAQMREAGYPPQSAGSTFSGRSFAISRIDGPTHNKINF